ncbi:hypothetical protein Hdeb2414_s0003g00100381 [Helianthus debilis subsp. tardiflorus]
MKYYLKIEGVRKGGVVTVFDAELVVQPSKNSKELLGFKLAHVNKQRSTKSQADLHQDHALYVDKARDLNRQ